MPRVLLPFLGLICLLAAAAPAHGAAAPAAIKSRTVLNETLRTTGDAAGACHTRARSGAGIVVDTVRVRGGGPIEARLDAPDGDWDLAIFDQKGRSLAAGAGAGADEIATGWAWEAGTLRVQACRRVGSANVAKVTLSHGTIPASLAAWAKGQKVKMVSVHTPTRADKQRLVDLGLDLTEHGGTNSLGVVLHGDDDEKKLLTAGFKFDVLEDDMVARARRERTADARYAAATKRAPVPSGRTSYRTLADYEAEMKKLAQENPGLVKLIELPNKTFMGRTVYGLEITTDVNVADGKPAFFNMGVHHAREWPAGEHAMEWAYELINGFKKNDPRTTRIVRESRNIIVPIVNPDGFNASRTAGSLGGADGGRDEEVEDTAYIVAGVANGGEYRRKNCRVGDTTVGNCTTSPGVAENGTDPNRNYGGLWGGPGAGTTVEDMTYRGPGPFSEPETKNIQWVVSRKHVMTLITNHTTAGLVLRAPGLLSLGDPIDEEKGYKALGDAMAMENGYFSQKSWELYDTTGTTEDWSYNATGGFGFTFEIYCGAPNYATGNCDDPAFHPLYATMAKEWDGTSDQSNHKTDPGRSGTNPFGMQKNYDGKGNREAYYIAAESTLNEKRHSVLEGAAPAGATLKLTKAFKTETYPQGEGNNAKPLTFDDRLETSMEVPATGKFRWHINPSTRPIVGKDRGREAKGNPSPPQTFNSSSKVPPTVPCTPLLICAVGNDDRTLKIPTGPGIDNGKVRIRIQWATQASDYDLKIFRPGASAISQDTLASSARRGTNAEEVVINEPSGDYLIRIANVAAAEPWTGTITFEKPDPLVKGITEAWKLTCEFQGQVLQSSDVVIGRGEVQQPDLGPCDRRVRELRGAAPAAPAPTVPPVLDQGRSATCAVGSGFSSVNATPSGKGVRFSFTRRVNNPVTVSIFQQSTGRSITGERLVARFTRRTKAFTWNGRATSKRRRVRDGYLFARLSVRTPEGVDGRRITLQRRGGRFVKRRDFYRRATCDRLPSFKLERPVFGGRTNRPLNISFRLADPSRVRVEVVRGTTVVKRFGPIQRRAGVTHRFRVDPKSLRPGEYRVRISVLGGTRPLQATLFARRL